MGFYGPQLKLIVCGSSTTWMLAKFIGDKGGLYGRVTRQIYLAPFSLGETELFLNELKGLALTRQQVLDVYMILGVFLIILICWSVVCR